MHIRLQDVVKRFGHLEAVSRISLEIADGELFTLLGPSGCGKTTILRLIAGFYRPDEGAVFFGGRAVSGIPPYLRNIGMVFQNYALWPHMTIFQNVAYGLRLRKLPRDEIASKVRQTLQLVNLAGLEGRYPGQLSGGQQQRVALARALVLNPHVLLLDEPLSNLDAKVRLQVRAEIRTLQQRLGITTVYVTHDQEEALTLSDRIAVVDHGRLQQVGSPRELYERPENPFVADFIGINNLIAGAVCEDGERGGSLHVRTAVGTLGCIGREALAPGDDCMVVIRPETAAIADNDEAPDGINSIPGTVRFASYIGNTIRYDVEIVDGLIFKVDVQNPWGHEPFPPGQAVFIRFPASVTLAIRGSRPGGGP
jgi:spermidine/putrescine ABC transporter ATP-binding subunit